VSAPPGWLAIDTATDIASVAISAHGLTAARSVGGARQHAAQIVRLIHDVLEEVKLSAGQICGVVVGDGPGSFTGLRIGWAAARALTHERQLPLVAIPSLLAAAHAAGVDMVAACYDALRGQVFGAIYVFDGQEVKALVEPAVFTIAELAARGTTPVLAVGDGAQKYREEVLAWTGREPVGLTALPSLAGSLLALFSYDGARRPIRTGTAEPVYGRPAEAQVKWESRHGRPLPNSSR
jgi:tRNA threonylcarbamoyladenosine biosynthesis protein TsaB